MLKKAFATMVVLSALGLTMSAHAEEDNRGDIHKMEKELGIPSVQEGQQDMTKPPLTTYDKCTPNPMALCSGPRPPKGDPYMRRCWDKLCPEQKKAFYNKFN